VSEPSARLKTGIRRTLLSTRQQLQAPLSDRRLLRQQRGGRAHHQFEFWGWTRPAANRGTAWPPWRSS